MQLLPPRILLPLNVYQLTRGVPLRYLWANRKPYDVLPLPNGIHVSISCY